MDRPAFSGRRRSSVMGAEGQGIDAPPTSEVTLVAPRKASTWDSLEPHGVPSSTSNISTRRASATTDDPSQPLLPSEYSVVGSIAGRKASTWDDSPAVGGSSRSSISDIAGRRPTATDRPPWDIFAGPPPAYEGATWAWSSEIAAITSNSNPIAIERNKLFLSGNLDYIFDRLDGEIVAIDVLKDVMYAYGVDLSSVEAMAKMIDPETHGNFGVNAHSKQTLLAANVSFRDPTDPLNCLRHASNCFQQNLLAPYHFAGYIFDILIGLGCLGGQPPFMLLGMYGILGVLGSPTDNVLTMKEVETFISMWRVPNPNDAEDLKDIIKDDDNGTISIFNLYNLLYRRNVFGKQRIEMFDTKRPQDPSLVFSLMDKNDDGFLLPADLKVFAATVGRAPSNDSIDRAIRKLDLDGDGKINLVDFQRAMMPVFNGMTWEFWLVATLLTLEL